VPSQPHRPPTRRITPARRVVLLALAALLALGGCASGSGPLSDPAADPAAATVRPWSQLRPLSDPKSYVGPTTAHISDASIEAVTTTPHPVLPATVTDAQGTAVTVTSDERILALDLYGSLSATVFGLGLGGQLVGRDQSTGFPEALHLPLVTSNAHQLNAEAILALHPTVLLTDTTLGPWNVVLQLRAAGIPVVVVDAQRSLGTVGALVDQVAAALGVRAEGALLADRLDDEIRAEEQRIAQVVPAAAEARLRIVFLYVRGQAGVYYIFGKGSGVDSLIDAVGGIDVATEAGITGFQPLNAEALAKTRPDVIVMMTAGLESVGGVAGALRLPGVAQTPAGQHHRIVDMNDYQILSFGPLAARVLDALARALYAPESLAPPSGTASVAGR
jgi:iron complex transport system substrate-binding protein